MNDIPENAIQRLQAFITENYGGNISAASRALGLKADLLNKWIKGTRSPSMLKLQAAIEALDKLVGQDKTPEPAEVIAKLKEENKVLKAQLEETKKKLAEAEIRLDERRRWALGSATLGEVRLSDGEKKKASEEN